MKNIDIIKEIKKQLGRVPTLAEIEQLCNKPSILVGKAKEKKAKLTSEMVEEYKTKENQSWFYQLKRILQQNPERVCIRYRGTEITGKELIKNVERLASALVKKGVKENDVIAVCMENTPEYIYVKCALNYIGAICNSFVPNYTDNKLDEILNNSSKKVIFITDCNYGKIRNKIGKFENIFLNSKADSLSQYSVPPIEYNENLREQLKKYYEYKSEVEEIASTEKNIIDMNKYLASTEINENLIKGLDERKAKADDICSITYTSGSTSDNPKGMYHTNSSIIISAIRHRKEVSGTASMEGLSSLFNIHSDSNTGNITQCLDILFQGGIVLPEPEYSIDSFLDVLYINKPNIAASTTSFFVSAAKQAKKYYIENKIEKMQWLFVPVAVGEGLTKKEEKFLNSFLHYVKAGKGFKIGGLVMPISTVMSIGGGDCERGGIFFTILKSIKEIKNKITNKGEKGLESYPDVNICALNPVTLEELDYGQTGIIVTSETEGTLKGYTGNDANISTIIIDKYGRRWCNMNVEGSVNKDGSVKIIGRYTPKIELANGIKLSLNELNDKISSLKRIFSVSSNVINIDGENTIIINYIPCKEDEDRQYKINDITPEIEEAIKEDIISVLSKTYGNEILNYIMIRRLSIFPVTGSGKRNLKEIISWGTTNAEKIIKKSNKLKKNL